MVAPPDTCTPGVPRVPLDEVQGNILRAYGDRYQAVRHLVLRVADRSAARQALASMVDGDRTTPDVTPADRAPREEGFSWCLNVGFTYTGLEALGVPPASLKTFPPEFVMGMVARASLLADVGPSAPECWVGGLRDPRRVHLIVTIHGCEASDIEAVSDRVLDAQGGRAFALVSEPFDGHVMCDPKTGRRSVHFGYADGISQPRFVDIHDPEEYPDRLPFAPVGVVLLGYPSAIPHVSWKVPSPCELGRNGTFNAFRVLGQDVTAFENFLSQVEKDHGAEGIDRELVAAKLCGRWRSGVPLSLAPTQADEKAFHDDDRLNDFDYVGGVPGGISGPGSHAGHSGSEPHQPGDSESEPHQPRDSGSEPHQPGDSESEPHQPRDSGSEPHQPRASVDGDPYGVICPIGSHIRRTNPRGAHIVQRSANRTRALIRRGVPYGPEWDPDRPSTWDEPRGLLGNFICASLAAQFEAMQHDWINLGLQDPRITGTNDPLLGANDPATSSFTWPREDAYPVVLRGFSRFVFTRGGAYTFLPSLPAIRWIATQRSS